MFNRTHHPLENGIRYLRLIQKGKGKIKIYDYFLLFLLLALHKDNNFSRFSSSIFFFWLAHSFSENEKTKSSNSIDPKSMHHTDDRACSDVSLPNRSFLDNCRSLGQLSFDPRKHIGSQILSSNELHVKTEIIFLFSSIEYFRKSCLLFFYSCVLHSIYHRPHIQQ